MCIYKHKYTNIKIANEEYEKFESTQCLALLCWICRCDFVRTRGKGRYDKVYVRKILRTYTSLAMSFYELFSLSSY